MVPRSGRDEEEGIAPKAMRRRYKIVAVMSYESQRVDTGGTSSSSKRGGGVPSSSSAAARTVEGTTPPIAAAAPEGAEGKVRNFIKTPGAGVQVHHDPGLALPTINEQDLDDGFVDRPDSKGHGDSLQLAYGTSTAVSEAAQLHMLTGKAYDPRIFPAGSSGGPETPTTTVWNQPHRHLFVELVIRPSPGPRALKYEHGPVIKARFNQDVWIDPPSTKGSAPDYFLVKKGRLPRGLEFDDMKGIICGTVREAGFDDSITIECANRWGSSSTELKFEIPRGQPPKLYGFIQASQFDAVDALQHTGNYVAQG